LLGRTSSVVAGCPGSHCSPVDCGCFSIPIRAIVTSPKESSGESGDRAKAIVDGYGDAVTPISAATGQPGLFFAAV